MMTARNTGNASVMTPRRRKATTNGPTFKDAALVAADRAKERWHDVYDRTKAKAIEWEDGFERYVREKPVQSMLIATGTGVVLGLLLSRRRG